jgi:DNA-binding NtrC family response regulator
MARERRVLLVEDDPQNAETYLQQLRRDGVPVEHVLSAEEADRFVRERHPVLVVIGGKLSDGRGRKMIEGWSAEDTLADIPVWIVIGTPSEAMTWWHQSGNVLRCFEKRRVLPGRLSQEIRATLGLPYGDRFQGRRAS